MSIGLPISTYQPYSISSQESQLPHVFSVMVTLQVRTDLGRGPRGLRPTWFHFFFTNYIHNFCSCSRSKTLGSLQLTAIQPKNLTKIIKTFTMLIVF